MFRFHPQYFLIALIIFVIEVLIALYVHDNFIRPFMGDVLVVIFLYALLRAFTNFSVMVAALSILLFSFIIEFLQYFHFIDLIGLGDKRLARIVIGTSFSWWDLACYIVGILIVILVEKYRNFTSVI